jgi:hypothetical protein
MTSIPSQDYPTAAERRLSSQFVLTGLALLGLFVAFIVLFTNFPAGYNAPPGLSLESVALFARFWPYPSLAIAPDTFAALARILIVLLWAVYIMSEDVLRRCHSLITRRRLLYIIVAFTVVFTALIAFVMPPVLSSDVYAYAIFGRMMSTYHLNPYVATAGMVANDNLSAYVFWPSVTRVYGPAWTLVSAVITTLTGQNPLLTTVAFKLVAAGAHLINCRLVYVLARRIGGSDGLSALLLFAWNPLILIETAGSGHNDGVMMAVAFAGLLLFMSRRRLPGVAVLIVSILVKYLTAILLLFAGVVALLQERTWRAAAQLALRMAVAAAVTAAALYLPFWPHIQISAQQGQAGSALGAAMPNPLYYVLRAALTGVLDAVTHNSQAGESVAVVLPYVLNAIFVLLLVIAVIRLMREKGDWPQATEAWGVLTFVYLFLVFGGGFAWYAVAPLMIAVVGRQNRTNRLLLLACAVAGVVLMLFYATPIAAP